jgi:hypothetical protein
MHDETLSDLLFGGRIFVCPAPLHQGLPFPRRSASLHSSLREVLDSAQYLSTQSFIPQIENLLNLMNFTNFITQQKTTLLESVVFCSLSSYEREESHESGIFYRKGKFSLIFGARSGFLS